jgi:hypothetical protein
MAAAAELKYNEYDEPIITDGGAKVIPIKTYISAEHIEDFLHGTEIKLKTLKRNAREYKDRGDFISEYRELNNKFRSYQDGLSKESLKGRIKKLERGNKGEFVTLSYSVRDRVEEVEILLRQTIQEINTAPLALELRYDRLISNLNYEKEEKVGVYEFLERDEIKKPPYDIKLQRSSESVETYLRETDRDSILLNSQDEYFGGYKINENRIFSKPRKKAMHYRSKLHKVKDTIEKEISHNGLGRIHSQEYVDERPKNIFKRFYKWLKK